MFLNDEQQQLFLSSYTLVDAGQASAKQIKQAPLVEQEPVYFLNSLTGRGTCLAQFDVGAGGNDRRQSPRLKE